MAVKSNVVPFTKSTLPHNPNPKVMLETCAIKDYIQEAKQNLKSMPSTLKDDPQMVLIFCMFSLAWLENKLS